MFRNLGKALGLLRQLRGLSQERVAREAKIGKSQLSKYENGKELPKLDSLEKLLAALDVSAYDFFFTLAFVDERASALDSATPPVEPSLVPGSGSLLRAETEEAFSRLLTLVLKLHRLVFTDLLVGIESRGAARRESAPELGAGRVPKQES